MHGHLSVLSVVLILWCSILISSGCRNDRAEEVPGPAAAEDKEKEDDNKAPGTHALSRTTSDDPFSKAPKVASGERQDPGDMGNKGEDANENERVVGAKASETSLGRLSLSIPEKRLEDQEVKAGVAYVLHGYLTLVLCTFPADLKLEDGRCDLPPPSKGGIAVKIKLQGTTNTPFTTGEYKPGAWEKRMVYPPGTMMLKMKDGRQLFTGTACRYNNDGRIQTFVLGFVGQDFGTVRISRIDDRVAGECTLDSLNCPDCAGRFTLSSTFNVPLGSPQAKGPPKRNRLGKEVEDAQPSETQGPISQSKPSGPSRVDQLLGKFFNLSVDNMLLAWSFIRDLRGEKREAVLVQFESEYGPKKAVKESLTSVTKVIQECGPPTKTAQLSSGGVRYYWDYFFLVANDQARRPSAHGIDMPLRREYLATHDWHPPTTRAPTGGLVKALTGHPAAVLAVAVTADGRRAVSGSEDTTVRVWDIANGRAILKLRGHERAVNSVAVAHDGRIAVSASKDALLLWNLDTGEKLRSLTGHGGPVFDVALSPDSRLAVTASADETIRIWQIPSGEQLLTLRGHSGSVTAVAITPDGKKVVSASEDGTLKTWDLKTGARLLSCGEGNVGLSCVAVAPDSRYAITASLHGPVTMWDIETATLVRGYGGGTKGAVALTPDGKHILVGYASGSIGVLDRSSGKRLTTFEGHSTSKYCQYRGVHALAVLRTGGEFVSASGDRTLKLWKLDLKDSTDAQQ